MENFIEWKFNKKDVYLTEVTQMFITYYEFYLKAAQQLQHNSAMGNIKKLKKILRPFEYNRKETADLEIYAIARVLDLPILSFITEATENLILKVDVLKECLTCN